MAPSFSRLPWRDVLRPAPHEGLLDAALYGPEGLVASRVGCAVTPFERIRGLLGRDRIDPDEALMIRPCAQIHTFGLRFSIDAVFCDPHGEVVHVARLDPNHVTKHVRGSSCCFELAAGRAEACGLRPGVKLELRVRAS